MNDLTIDEAKELIRAMYPKIPQNRLGTTRCVNFDPAGSDYEFVEYGWSIRVREILNIKYEPTGI